MNVPLYFGAKMVTFCIIHKGDLFVFYLILYVPSTIFPTEKQIQMKTKEIYFSLFYFHFNYIVPQL